MQADPAGKSDPLPADNQAELAYELIEDMIVLMELEPGARVTEAMLATRLGIGRTPIREALLRLASDGLLIWLPRRGMVVRDINFSAQMKVFEVRRALQTVLVTTAARRRTRAEADQMLALVERFRDLLNGATQVDIMRLDRQFIRLLLELSRNPFLGQIIPLYSLSSRFWHAYQELYTNRYRYGTLTQFHIAIAEAVAAGDEAAARTHVEAFMDYVEEFTVYVGKELSDQDPPR
jgi:DNA-binding GntR family transcriptional regulator